MAWGQNDSQQCGCPQSDACLLAPTPVVGLEDCQSPELLAGRAHSAALCQSSGQPVLWGSGSAGHLGTGDARTVARPTPLQGVQQVTQLALGHQHTLLLDTSGTVFALGENKEVRAQQHALWCIQAYGASRST